MRYSKIKPLKRNVIQAVSFSIQHPRKGGKIINLLNKYEVIVLSRSGEVYCDQICTNSIIDLVWLYKCLWLVLIVSKSANQNIQISYWMTVNSYWIDRGNISLSRSSYIERVGKNRKEQQISDIWLTPKWHFINASAWFIHSPLML